MATPPLFTFPLSLSLARSLIYITDCVVVRLPFDYSSGTASRAHRLGQSGRARLTFARERVEQPAKLTRGCSRSPVERPLASVRQRRENIEVGREKEPHMLGPSQ